jgi:hypothetical protein
MYVHIAIRLAAEISRMRGLLIFTVQVYYCEEAVTSLQDAVFPIGSLHSFPPLPLRLMLDRLSFHIYCWLIVGWKNHDKSG